jgi:hypothetical protein
MLQTKLKFIACLLLLFFILGVVALRLMRTPNSSVQLFETRNSSNFGSAVFWRECGITDCEHHLYVRDTIKSGQAPIYMV